MIQQGPLRLLFSFPGPKTPSHKTNVKFLLHQAKEAYNAISTHHNSFWKIRSFFPMKLMLEFKSEGWWRVKLSKEWRNEHTRYNKGHDEDPVVGGACKHTDRKKGSVAEAEREQEGFHFKKLSPVDSTLRFSLDCVHLPWSSLLPT